MTPFDTSGEKRKSGGGGDNNKRANHDSGGRGGKINRGGNDGGGRGGNNNRGGNDGGGRGNNDGSHTNASHGGNDGGNRGCIHGGSIINASGQQMKLPVTLSKQYCGHFLDTELRCNFGQSCKKDHSSFPTEFADGDVTKILSFVESTRDLSWPPSIQLPATAVSRNRNRN